MIKDQLIVVTGATGSQGGSVVDVLLKDGWTKLRGVTRHPYSAAAKKLAAKGVEVVKGDFNSPVEDLRPLFRGMSNKEKLVKTNRVSLP